MHLYGSRSASPSRLTTLVWCGVLFLLGLILRVAFLQVFGTPDQRGGDMEGYMALARNVAGGLGFTFDGVTLSTYRPPLFSWLLGAWCYVAGSTALSTMIAYQVVVQALCAPLTYLLVRQAQPSHRFGLAGGIFVAAYPFMFTTVGLVLQEATQMLFATAMGMLVVAWWRDPSARLAGAAGASFGVCALAKSPFLLIPVILIIVWVLFREARRQFPLLQVIGACLMAAVVILPWTARNYRVSGGRFIPINSQDARYTIWMVADGGFPSRASLSEPRREGQAVHQGVALKYGNEDGVEYLRRRNDALLQQGVSGGAIDDGLAAAARSYLLRHPAYVLRITARGLILLFSPDAPAPFHRFLVLRVVAMVLFHVPLALGLVAGMVRAWREGNAAMGLLSLAASGYLLVHAPVTVAGGRYCAPLVPLLLALTGYGLLGRQR